jgi:hypothetical protein
METESRKAENGAFGLWITGISGIIRPAPGVVTRWADSHAMRCLYGQPIDVGRAIPRKEYAHSKWGPASLPAPTVPNPTCQARRPLARASAVWRPRPKSENHRSASSSNRVPHALSRLCPDAWSVARTAVSSFRSRRKICVHTGPAGEEASSVAVRSLSSADTSFHGTASRAKRFVLWITGKSGRKSRPRIDPNRR